VPAQRISVCHQSQNVTDTPVAAARIAIVLRGNRVGGVDVLPAPERDVLSGVVSLPAGSGGIVGFDLG
jgi:hypothetical protein